MKCFSSALLFFYMLNPYYLFAMNRVVQKEKKEVETTTSKKTGSQAPSPEVAKKEINIALPTLDVSVITPQPNATIAITSLSETNPEGVSPKIKNKHIEQIKDPNDLSLDDEFITYNTLAETSAPQENKILENNQSVPASLAAFITYNPINSSKTETSEYNNNNNSSGAIYGEQSSLGAEPESSSSKIPASYMLPFAAQIVKEKNALYSTAKKISLSPKEKEIIFKALYSAQYLKKEFERGTQERKSYNVLIREINKVIDLLPAQDKTALVSELHGLNGYASDEEEYSYEKNFKAKDLLRIANTATCAGISSQMQTIFDAVASLDKQIAELQEKKNKLSTDHTELQNKHDHIEQISELFYTLEVKDHQSLLLTREETTQAVATLKNEITTLEKSYANEKDAKNKVTLLSALNEKRKTASPEIAQKEKLIAALNADISRMEKRLYPNQNIQNASYLSLSGITNFFWGSKQAQPTIEDKK